MPKPLNVIIITSDEMRGDCYGAAGNRDIRTPNLDALAGSARHLRRHFAVHGKCVPSRISLATGRYCHTGGFRSINEENHLPDGDPDLLTTLKARGYETAVFGHNHVWSNFWGDNTPRSSVVDYHSFTKEIFAPLLQTSRPVPETGPHPEPELPDGFDYSGRITKPLSGFMDANRTDQAIHYLATVRDTSRPFFMQLNLGWPHPKYHAHEPWFSLYDRSGITAWPHALPNNAPLPLRTMREIRTGGTPSEAHLREIQATYYGMIGHVDENVGRLLAAIDAAGLRDNTVLLFTADHGDFAGQYGLIEKWDTAMQDCILHVPCILRAPGLGSGTYDGLSEHVDLAPTILDLVEVPTAERWSIHGQSLVNAIAHGTSKPAIFADGGHEAAARARFDREVYSVNKTSGKREMTTAGKQLTYSRFPDTMARTKMVRTDEWKLVVRETGGDELYHLRSDPWELNNVIDDAAHGAVIRDLQRRLLDWCLRTDPDQPRLASVGA